MRTFKVTIRATITKDIHVEIDDDLDVDHAIAMAHEQFSVLNDGTHENYDEETLEWRELT